MLGTLVKSGTLILVASYYRFYKVVVLLVYYCAFLFQFPDDGKLIEKQSDFVTTYHSSLCADIFRIQKSVYILDKTQVLTLFASLRSMFLQTDLIISV